MRAFEILILIPCIYAVQQATFATASSIFSNKIRVMKCSPRCPESRNFKYEREMSYRFSYSMDTFTQMGGANMEEARLAITSDVKIDVLGRCEMALRLHNTQLHISNERGIMKKARREELSAFKQAVGESSLRFSFQDGVVNHLCLEAGHRDPPWVLNFKRGILSVFQSGMMDWTRDQNVTETDVVGECRAQYKMVRETPQLVHIIKVKDVLACRQRRDNRRSFFSVPYGIHSDVQSLPILTTSHRCDQLLNTNGLLQQSHCTERHVFRPLTQGGVEVSATVTESLKYIKTRWEGKRYRAQIVQRQPLTFDHTTEEVKPERGRFKVEKILRDICKSTVLDIRTETPRVYSELVGKMRLLDRTDMERVYYLLKTKDLCFSNDKTLQLFLDALPATATRAALKLMTSLLTSGYVTGVRATIWMTSIGFIASPNDAMLHEVKPLLGHKRTRLAALLPVSSMVYNFCLHHVTLCSNHRSVSDLVSTLEARLGHWCDGRGRKQEEVLLSLRALGNLGHVTRAVSIINKCLIRASNPLGVRIAAAESFRRMSCEKQTRHRRYLWELFTSSCVDAELRQASYLAMMRCADVNFVQKVLGRVNKMANKDGVGSEEKDREETKEQAKVRSDAEVKAFVYSHLMNIRGTSSPSKQSLRETMKRLPIESDVAMNQLNISRNFELSTLDAQLNAGITAEGNLLWSGKSRFPRALSTNLTLELFGRSFNALDFGARVVGFEDLLKTAYEKYDQGKLSHWLKRYMPKEIEGQVFLRVFGNEVLFMRMSDLVGVVSGHKSGLLPTNLADFLTRLSGDQNKAITRAIPIIDASMTIPTISGFPIRLAVNGSAIVDLGFKGIVDFRNTKSNSFNIDGELKASAAMEVTGSLSVDATVTQIGVRMRDTAHTSTGVKGRVGLDKGHNFNFELDTPRDDVEVFKARSRFFTVHGNREKQKPSAAKEERAKAKICSGKKMAAFFGFELCAESNSPVSSLRTNYAEYLLNGPARIAATLYKRDRHDRYQFSAKLSQSKRNKIFHVHFDTPGSKFNRKLGVDSTYNAPKQEMNAIVVLPWRRTTVNVTLASRHGFHLATGSVLMNETSTLYACAAELRIVASKDKVKLRPKISVRIPRRKDLDLEGAISIYGTLHKPRSVNTDISLSGLAKTNSTLQGKITTNDLEKSIKLDLVHKRQRFTFHWVNKMTMFPRRGVTIDSYVDVVSPQRRYLRLMNALNWNNMESLKLQTHVEIPELLKKIQLYVSLSRSMTHRRGSYDAEIWIKCPPLSSKFKGEIRTTSHKLMTSHFALSYSIPEFAKNEIQLKSKFESKARKSQQKKWIFTSVLNIKSNPEYDLAFAIGLDLHQKHDILDLLVRYGNDPKDKRKQLRLKAEVKKQIHGVLKAALSYHVKVHFPLLEIDVILSGKHHHSTKKFENNFNFHQNSRKKVALSLRLENHSKKLKKYQGEVDIFWVGEECSLTTEFDQKTIRLLVHRMTFTRQGLMTFDVLTRVETPKFKAVTLKTQIFAEGSGRATIEASALIQSRKLQFSGKATRFRTLQTEDAYGFYIEAIRPRSLQTVKISSEVFYPERRVTLKMSGTDRPEKKGGQLEINLNADRKSCGERCLINAKSLVIKKRSGETKRVLTKFDLSTPFKNFNKLGVYTVQATNSSLDHIDCNVYWGEKRKKKIAGAMKIRKPLRWHSIQANFFVKTPMMGYQSIESEISHKLSPEVVSLVNKISGLTEENVPTYEEDKKIWQDENARDFQLSTELDANTKLFSKKLGLTLEHYNDKAKFQSSCNLVHDQELYSCDVRANLVAPNGLCHVQSFGELLVKSPSNVISAGWDHKNTMSVSRSLLKSSWNSDRVMVVLHGSQRGWDSNITLNKSISSTLIVENTPKFLKNVTVVLDHKQTQSWFKNRIEVLEGLKHGENKDIDSIRDILAVSELKASWDNASTEANYALKTSKWENPIKANVRANFSSLPYYSDATLVWSPNKTVSAQGSIGSLQWDDLDLEIDVQTPFLKFPNTTLTLQSQWLKEERDFLINSTAEVYDQNGESKKISMDARLSANEASKVAIRVLSPFEGHHNWSLIGLYSGQDMEIINSYGELKVDESFRLITELNLDRVTSYNFRLSGESAKFVAPGLWRSNSNITIEHKSNGGGGEYETNAVIKVAPGAIVLRNRFSITEPNSLDYSLILQTPLKHYRKLGAEVGYRYGVDNFTAKARVIGGRRLQFQGKIERKDTQSERAFRSLLNFTTPFTDTLAYDLALMHNGEGAEMKCALDTFFEDFRGFLVHGAFFAKPDAYLNVTGELRLPLVKLNKAELSFLHSETERRVTSSVCLDYDRFSLSSDVDASYQSPSLEANFSMKKGDEKIKAFTRYSRVRAQRDDVIPTPSLSSLISSPYPIPSSASSSSSSSSSSFSSSASLVPSWLGMFFGSKTTTTTATTLPPPPPPPPPQTTLDLMGNHHDLLAVLDLGQGKLYTFGSDLDLRSRAILLFAEVNTPLENLQRLRAEFSHRGRRLNDFQTTGSLLSPWTGSISASAGADFKRWSELSAHAILTGDKLLPAEANDLELKVITLSDAEGGKCFAEMQWTKNKQITLDTVAKKHQTGHVTRLVLLANMTSPFERLKEVGLMVEFSREMNVTSHGIHSIKVAVENDRAVDLELEYQNSGRRLLRAKVKQPWEAHLNGELLSVSQDGGRFLNISWQSPALNDINSGVKGEVTVDTTGSVPFDAHVTAIYADDVNKSLTFTSQLIKNGDANGCCNHSLRVDLTRPSSGLDLRATSGLLVNQEQLSAKVKLSHLHKDGTSKIVASLAGKLNRSRHDLIFSIKTNTSDLRLRAGVAQGLELSTPSRHAQQSPANKEPLLEFLPLNISHLVSLVTGGASALSDISDEMRTVSEELVAGFSNLQEIVTSELPDPWTRQTDAAHVTAALNSDSWEQNLAQKLSLVDPESHDMEQRMRTEEDGSDGNESQWWFWLPQGG